MDKRKQSSPDGRISKRRRQTPSETPDRDTEATPAELGRILINIIGDLTDRKGNKIAEAFQEVPSEEDLPDYRKMIKNPISLDIIESKLEHYVDAAELKGDLDLLTGNAQSYNQSNSKIHYHAGKIRNIVAQKLAPYIKSEMQESAERRSGRTSRNVPTTEEQQNSDIKEALLAVLKDMTEVKDANGEGAIDHFMELPLKRHYADYYQMITDPTCIKDIRKKLRKDEFKESVLVDDFEDEVMRMFGNAVEYNAEGSDILDDVDRLKVFFLPRMADERKKFGKPPRDLSRIVLKKKNGKPGNLKSPSSERKIKIHLNVPEPNGIKLRINNKFGRAVNDRNSGATRSDDRMDIDETPDAKISTDAMQEPGKANNMLKREISDQGKVGSPATRSPTKPTPLIPVSAQHTTRSSSKSATPVLQHSVPAAVKGGEMKLGSASPAPTVRAGQPMISPSPSTNTNHTANHAPGTPAAQLPEKPAPAVPVHSSFGDRKARREGKTIHDSPIQRLHIQTSARIQSRERLDISLYPDEKMWFSSNTLHISADNNLLIVTAHMHPKICSKEALSSISLALNGNIVKHTENPQAPNGGLFSWELPLTRGTTNTIECASNMQSKPSEEANQPEAELERVQFVIFAFLAPKY